MISKHVSYNEVIRSDIAKRKGIENIPTKRQLVRIRILCQEVFEPLREFLRIPIFLSSVFRSSELNKVLGGAKNSQHLANNGAAMDLDADVFGYIPNKDIGNYIRKNLEFDQLIYEDWKNNDYAWIHCSYNEGKNRNQVLIMERKNGKVTYESLSII